MEITLILKCATPAEVREALRELYAQGTPGEPMEAQPYELEEKALLPPLPACQENRCRKSYSPDENIRIVKLHNKGYSWDDIAAYLGRKNGNSIRTQYCVIKKQGGI